MSCLRCQLSRSPAHRSPSSFYAERAFSERYIRSRPQSPVCALLRQATWQFAATKRTEIAAHYGIDPLGPLLLMAGAAFVACILARPRRGLAAFGGVLASVLLVVSFWVNPAMNSARSGADFMRRVEQTADPVRELGIVAAKEQYLLNAQRPIVHFGSRRWREGEQEAFDAARWLSRSPGRQLIVSSCHQGPVLHADAADAARRRQSHRMVSDRGRS